MIHVGLPKTGTKSLQSALSLNREALLQQGIYYPKTGASSNDINHPWITGALLGDDSSLARLESELKLGSSQNLILLSHEGVTNQLYRISRSESDRFRKLTRSMNISIFLCLRKPDTWLRSYWGQCLINPPTDHRYASNHSPDELAKLPSVKILLDKEALIERLSFMINPLCIRTSLWEDEKIFSDLCLMLGINPKSLIMQPMQKNRSLLRKHLELIQKLNGLNLHPDTRASFLYLFAKEFESKSEQLNFYMSNLKSMTQKEFQEIIKPLS